MSKVFIAGGAGVDPALIASAIAKLENNGIVCVKEKEPPLNGVELVLPNYGVTAHDIMVFNKLYPTPKLDMKVCTKKELYIVKRNKIKYKAKKRNYK